MLILEVQRSKGHARSMIFFGKIKTMPTKMWIFHEPVKYTPHVFFCLKGYKISRNLRIFWSKSEHMVVFLFSVPSDFW